MDILVVTIRSMSNPRFLLYFSINHVPPISNEW